jgi:heat shock protein HslJ
MTRTLLALVLGFTLATSAAPAQTGGAGGWALVSVGGIAAQPGGRIAFSADGAVFGTTGCNRFNGQAVAAPGVLTFGTSFAVTKMACVGEMMTQEMQVLEALKGTVAVAYDPVADRMMLIPATGAPVLGFARDD